MGSGGDAALDPRIADALRPPRPGRVVRALAPLVPGVRRTESQIVSFAGRWRDEATSTLAADLPVLIVLGDSLGQGIGASSTSEAYAGQLAARLRDDVGPVGVLNLSRSGARIADVVDTQLPALDAAAVTATAVVCTVGSNDLLGTGRPGRFRHDVDRLVGALADARVDRTVLATLPDRGSIVAKLANRQIRRSARDHGITVADVAAALDSWRGRVAPDRFHPNDAGHRLWADTFHRALVPR